MKIHAIISFLCLASVALGTSCKDDETHFLQRSHDALSFPYLNSTKELLVLTNGSRLLPFRDVWWNPILKSPQRRLQFNCCHYPIALMPPV